MDLDEWRSRINNLDNQILLLLNERAEAALKIGDLKRQRDTPVYSPAREAEVLQRVAEGNAGDSAQNGGAPACGATQARCKRRQGPQ